MKNAIKNGRPVKVDAEFEKSVLLDGSRRETIQSSYCDGWNAACEAYEKWEKERPAKWIELDYIAVCSACHQSFRDEVLDESYCPDCGRKMEKWNE